MEIAAAVRGELSRLSANRPCCRKAETSVTLRFAAVSVSCREQRLEAGLDSRMTAERLRKAVLDVYGHRSDLVAVNSTSPQTGIQYLVRVTTGSGHLAIQAGLVDGRGNPVQGLPPRVVSGPVCDAEAAWRGAFLVCGTLSEPGRYASLEIACPGPEVALALAGAARRLSVPAQVREARTGREVLGPARVVIRDPSAIPVLLNRIGAQSSASRWAAGHITYEERNKTSRTVAAGSLANCLDTNTHRSARVAVVMGTRARRALEILGDETPQHLAVAAQLRIEHKHASLEELARLADPPITKDTIAGRIRRLLNMADRHAKSLGVPDTQAHHAATAAGDLER